MPLITSRLGLVDSILVASVVMSVYAQRCEASREGNMKICACACVHEYEHTWTNTYMLANVV
jgi:hypothetical protein